jgi:hypothetical protein
MFVTLMVGAPGSPSAPSKRHAVDVFYIDGGCFRISISTRQGARRQYFLTLMVDAPGSSALAPHREPAIDVCYVDSGRSRISVGTYQGPTIDVS